MIFTIQRVKKCSMKGTKDLGGGKTGVVVGLQDNCSQTGQECQSAVEQH